jgi:hypothetical protein
VSPLKLKVEYFLKSPYDQTLFLDVDTMVSCDISNMFKFLDGYDIALSGNEKFATTGVFLYNNNSNTFNFITKWSDKIIDSGDMIFNSIKMNYDVRINYIDDSYNNMDLKTLFRGCRNLKDVKILHSHFLDSNHMKEIIKRKSK